MCGVCVVPLMFRVNHFLLFGRHLHLYAFNSVDFSIFMRRFSKDMFCFCKSMHLLLLSIPR